MGQENALVQSTQWKILPLCLKVSSDSYQHQLATISSNFSHFLEQNFYKDLSMKSYKVL